jgi:superfamily I DNA/RNA helicase
VSETSKAPNPESVEQELKDALQRILESDSRRKLIIAGPGTGKTTLFKKLLEQTAGNKKSRLVLTFITNLRDELEKALSNLCKVSTLHSYCQSILRSTPTVRSGLTKEFVCQPEMASLIKEDWTYLRKTTAPEFVNLMRNLEGEEELQFYFQRANYYDAVDFDDSVYRTAVELKQHAGSIPKFDLVLIDEYQDFNRMEASLIEALATQSPIVIAGDDDQALYSQLRGASWEHIRSLHNASDYEVFQLPFCMRCPEVVVAAVNDILSEARSLQKLDGRIDKPYKHFEPVKGADSRLYPTIGLVRASVQRRKGANYFGRFIDAAIAKIPQNEIEEANDKGEPVVLVIGSKQYLRQVEEYLVAAGRMLEPHDDHAAALSAERALELLKANQESNLGWRIILALRTKGLAISCVRQADNKRRLHEVVPEEFKNAIIAEVEKFVPPSEANAEKVKKPEGVTIKLTSFQGAKGMSAQHVFLVGLHAGDLPRDANDIQDLEICKFLVGLTRTKKHCALLWTTNFSGTWKDPSIFLRWIKDERYDPVLVDAHYWKAIH